ncbi:glycosyl transferase family 2 [Bordetella genomosp. 10]|uniref:Glycosyl transferase family 2 n=1 Tax=Bordetella genomosp. 10 TaxID=1416804 RepID=A0A261RZ58_9BORD|nr:glycosyltransferase family 2 protein [Bordetella genomosp. 10]OZI30205.1 glycosyl transferase family 2 [Bordetella genomosp. 10]
MSYLLHLILAIIAFPVTVATGYLGVLTLLSARLPRPQPSRRDLCFDILVPAHNEAAVIERTLRSLANVDWPRKNFRILVIADNCTDDTADLARAAGATVLERHDEVHRGKGYALEYGIARSAADGRAHAVAVIDADTEVTPNLLSAYAARIEAGAAVMQVHYGVLNPEDSWRTRLVTMAYGAFHAVRGRGRERLRASFGLRGNGMCMTHELLREVPFNIHSMTEDLEYGIVLGLHGHRVVYIDEASADAELIASERGSRTQRQRWEGGRLGVVRAYTGRLLGQGLRQPSWLCIELAMDLLTLPLGYIVLQTAALLALGGLASLSMPGVGLWVWPLLAAVLLMVLALHVLRGWQLSPLGPRALLDLARAPFFVLWKLYIVIRNRGNEHWIRTDRGKARDKVRDNGRDEGRDEGRHTQ